jgi:hypothetical protein
MNTLKGGQKMRDAKMIDVRKVQEFVSPAFLDIAFR